ncbi:MAG TPA: ABC transporter ATP-binding protein [Polyangiaceae bacterium]|nr:ABC transporter ATP-binding protein [Polyangiaceae bacterium]
MTAPDIAVRMRSISKAYGACVANASADLEVLAGEVHALVGENGAGKSTLMQVLSGLVRPDAGTVEVFGRDVTGWTTAQAIEAKVGMVHQHFMLVPTLTVAENVVLGREPTKGARLDLEKARADVARLAEETGLAVPPDALVGELSIGAAQRVEILKALHRGASVLILDEPTAVLSPPEVADFLRVLRKLQSAGTTVVLITHKLSEVMSASQRITVMRRGRTVGTFVTGETTAEQIAEKMVGRSVDLAGIQGGAARSPAAKPTADPVLVAEDVVIASARAPARQSSRRAERARAVDGVSFELRPGEILGIAGVEGNGQTELVLGLAGLLPIERGSVRLLSRDVTRASPRERERAGLAHVPEDRHGLGLVLDYSIEDNLILGRQDRFTRAHRPILGLSWGLLDEKRIREHANALIDEHDIRPRDPRAPARSLSGGNQQKIVVAREMAYGFRVLVAAQPTRGVDVGAIEAIHARLRAARDEGRAVLLVSAELAEVLALADRVAVMFRGRFAALMSRDEASPEILGPYMIGAKADRAAGAA